MFITDNNMKKRETKLEDVIKETHASGRPEHGAPVLHNSDILDILGGLDSTRVNLQDVMQQRLSERFGVPMRGIKVFEDEGLGELGSRGYAKGNEIHIAKGEYRPHTQRGADLLMHEAGHVVQQGMGLVSGTGLLSNPALEAQASAGFTAPANFSMPVSANGPAQGDGAFEELKKRTQRLKPSQQQKEAQYTEAKTRRDALVAGGQENPYAPKPAAQSSHKDRFGKTVDFGSSDPVGLVTGTPGYGMGTDLFSVASDAYTKGTKDWTGDALSVAEKHQGKMGVAGSVFGGVSGAIGLATGFASTAKGVRESREKAQQGDRFGKHLARLDAAKGVTDMIAGGANIAGAIPVAGNVASFIGGAANFVGGGIKTAKGIADLSTKGYTRHGMTKGIEQLAAREAAIRRTIPSSPAEEEKQKKQLADLEKMKASFGMARSTAAAGQWGAGFEVAEGVMGMLGGAATVVGSATGIPLIGSITGAATNLISTGLSTAGKKAKGTAKKRMRKKAVYEQLGMEQAIKDYVDEYKADPANAGEEPSFEHAERMAFLRKGFLSEDPIKEAYSRLASDNAQHLIAQAESTEPGNEENAKIAKFALNRMGITPVNGRYSQEAVFGKLGGKEEHMQHVKLHGEKELAQLTGQRRAITTTTPSGASATSPVPANPTSASPTPASITPAPTAARSAWTVGSARTSSSTAPRRVLGTQHPAGTGSARTTQPPVISAPQIPARRLAPSVPARPTQMPASTGGTGGAPTSRVTVIPRPIGTGSTSTAQPATPQASVPAVGGGATVTTPPPGTLHQAPQRQLPLPPQQQQPPPPRRLRPVPVTTP